MQTTPERTDPAEGIGPLSWVGLGVVGVAAAILTFTALRDLATACGIVGDFLIIPLPWLVPVTVDAAGAVAARIWLKGRGGAEAVRFAKRMSWTCIALSISGNAAQHGMEAYGITPPWWVIVIVAAVPPAMVGAIVHLVHLPSRRHQEPAGDVAGDLEPQELEVHQEDVLEPLEPIQVELEPVDLVKHQEPVVETELENPRPLELEAPGEPETAGAGGALVHLVPRLEPTIQQLLDEGAGRPALIKAGCTEHEARKLIAERKAANAG